MIARNKIKNSTFRVRSVTASGQNHDAYGEGEFHRTHPTQLRKFRIEQSGCRCRLPMSISTSHRQPGHIDRVAVLWPRRLHTLFLRPPFPIPLSPRPAWADWLAMRALTRHFCASPPAARRASRRSFAPLLKVGVISRECSVNQSAASSSIA